MLTIDARCAGEAAVIARLKVKTNGFDLQDRETREDTRRPQRVGMIKRTARVHALESEDFFLLFTKGLYLERVYSRINSNVWLLNTSAD